MNQFKFISISLIFITPLMLFGGCSINRKSPSGEASQASQQMLAEPNSLYAQSAQPAQTRGDEISNSRRNAITNAVAVASPAVVGINVTEVREYQTADPFRDPFFDQFFGNRRRKSPTYRQEVKSLGSGFLISADGYIVTNAHVVANGNATKVVVTTTDKKRYDAKLIGTDVLMDIALLKIDATSRAFLRLGNSDDATVGEWAIAIGNPFGLFEINDKPTVTVGVVSATGLDFPSDDKSFKGMIQTDAAINSGNSGGPLLNANAEVMGVNTFIYTGGGQGSIGIGFAIPINRVKKIVDELRTKGTIDRSFRTGITVQAIDEGIARYLGVRDIQGVIITGIEGRSAGDRAGLEVGDIITEVAGAPITSEQNLRSALFEYRAGDMLKLKIYRDRKYLEITLRLEK